MGYSIGERRWHGRRCRLKINGFDIPKEWMASAKRAMTDWNNAGAHFRFVVDNSAPSSIVCEELGGNGWVGLTTLRPPEQEDPYIKQVQIRLNTQHAFEPPHPTTQPALPGPPYDLYSVLLHELGHALHLGEDYDTGSATAMQPTIRAGEVRSLTPDDILGIKLLYP